jgi:hypothetical protein
VSEKDVVQEEVDVTFRLCLQRDLRTLELIQRAVRAHVAAAARLTDHELQILISRNCTGDGEWDYFPAYTRPPRYVSRARVLELARLEVERGLDVWERAELDAQLGDLERGVAHWRAKHAVARQREAELDALIQRARHHPLGV